MFASNRYALALLGVILGATLLAVLLLDKPQPEQVAPIIKGPDYNETNKPQSPPELKPTEVVTSSTESAHLPAPLTGDATGDALGSHTFREDGRIYSVALVAGTTDMAVGEQVLAQGTLARFGYAGMQSRPYAVLNDEQQPEKTLMCAMQEDEGAQVQSLYHAQEVVRVSGEYMGNLPIAGSPSMPILSNCQVAGRGNNVVRAADTDSGLSTTGTTPKVPSDLTAKCSPYVNTRLEDLESKRVSLPPHECREVLAWMRDAQVESLYNKLQSERQSIPH